MFTLVVPIQASLPELLDASREDTAWVVTTTLLAAAVITPISGRLGDMYGKRRIVLVLLATMVVGSVIAAVSDEILGVLVGRTLQGAATGVVPLGISILRDVLHQERVGSAVALISATMGVGGALGMPVSAYITQYGNWHLLFWVSAALGAVIFALVAWIVPVSVLRTAGRFDYLGAFGLSAGLTGILLAVSRGNEWGWTSPGVLGSGLGGLVILLGWGWYELRVKDPLLNLRVAVRPPVLLTNLASVAFGFSLFASNVAYPQLLELPPPAGLGMSLLGASLVIAPSGLMMMVLSPVAGRLARAMGPRILMLIGAAAITLAYAVSLLVRSEVWHILVANLLIGVGIGFGFAAMPLLIMRSVPHSETGASNGLNALFRSVGTSTAAAVIGAVLAAQSRPVDGVQIPVPAAFETAFFLGGGAAALALVLALFIPRRAAEESRPSLPVE